MRVIRSRAGRNGSTSGLLGVMDDFAALRADDIADPAIGGYRVLRARPAGRAPISAPAVSMPKGIRARGLLAVLLTGTFALVVLPGPASCPCGAKHAGGGAAEAATGTWNVSRFAYMKPTSIALDDATQTRSGSDLGAAESRANTAPSERTQSPPIAATEAMGASPLSTSAIPPASAVPTHGVGQHAGGLPAKIEEVSDTAPRPLALAATGERNVTPTLPVVKVATPRMPEIVAVEQEGDPTTTPDLPHKRPSHKRPSSRPHSVPKRTSTVRREYAESEAARARRERFPPWAQRMFERPWQTKAFNYRD